ncbi:AMIN-like domain-containing (lipo)protein, partial [Corynebacterium casei]
MSIRRISLSALGLVTATTLLAACSSPADETAASSVSPATSEESTSDTAASETTLEEQTSPTPSTVEATTDGSQAITPLGSPDVTDKQARPSEGTSLIPKGVRVADHGAFTRVVLDYEGEGKAGWYTQLTAEPAQQASGFPIEYDGATAIVIGVESTPWPSTPELEEAYMDSGK